MLLSKKKPLTVERKFAIVAKKSAIIAEFKTFIHHKKKICDCLKIKNLHQIQKKTKKDFAIKSYAIIHL